MIKRQTMKFIVPVSNQGTISSDASGKKTVEVYLNPTSFKISEAKLVESAITKGGFMVSYWGENLPTISAGGTTGSSGIEGIQILRDIYRNEQIVYKQILKERNYTSSEGLSSNTLTETTFDIYNIINTNSDPSSKGLKSTIENLISNKKTALEQQKQEILSPSIAAFATSVDIYFQGEKFRGFFKDFSYDENADRAGIFTYSFDFTILQRYGLRSNFMPWHRNPRDAAGVPMPADIPIEKSDSRLTFPVTPPKTTQEQISGVTSTIINTQELDLDPNSIPVIRSIRVKS